MKTLNRVGVPVVHMVALFLFLSIGYLIHFFLMLNPPERINHYYFLTGGFGVWLNYIMMSSSFIRERKSHVSKKWLEKKNNFFKRIGEIARNTVSFFGVLALFGAFLGGMMLITVSNITFLHPGATPEEIEQAVGVQQRVEFMFKLDVIFICFGVLCVIFIWSQFQVKDKNIVILNNKLFYPRERYRMWPFMYYADGRVIDEEIEIMPKSLLLRCKDVEFKTTVEVPIRLEIDQARQERLRNLNYLAFTKELKEWLSDLVQEQALQMTGGEMLKGKMKLAKTKISNFPITWNGDIHIVNA